jgi:hypothetical protein
MCVLPSLDCSFIYSHKLLEILLLYVPPFLTLFLYIQYSCKYVGFFLLLVKRCVFFSSRVFASFQYSEAIAASVK